MFLDELPEFNRKRSKCLRQPLEDGTVTISRALNSTTFPANFMLIAALNPCPCGYRNDPRRDCHCTVPQIERYMAKISGPLLDRIDIHIEVPAVAFKELASAQVRQQQRQMRDQVKQAAHESTPAIQRQPHAAKRPDDAPANPRTLPPRRSRCSTATRHHDRPGPLGPRHDKVLRVARTIADLDNSENISSMHLSEAVNYRMLDRQMWT